MRAAPFRVRMPSYQKIWHWDSDDGDGGLLGSVNTADVEFNKKSYVLIAYNYCHNRSNRFWFKNMFLVCMFFFHNFSQLELVLLCYTNGTSFLVVLKAPERNKLLNSLAFHIFIVWYDSWDEKGQLRVTAVFWILVFLYDSVVSFTLPSCDEDRFSSEVLIGHVSQLRKRCHWLQAMALVCFFTTVHCGLHRLLT